MSKDGKGIIAITSATKDGSQSKIVPALPVGATVTLPRHDVDYVVTEYGAAHLRGLSIEERRNALIDIAHPGFRDELRSSAPPPDKPVTIADFDFPWNW